jgi:hypothetical protein
MLGAYFDHRVEGLSGQTGQVTSFYYCHLYVGQMQEYHYVEVLLGLSDWAMLCFFHVYMVVVPVSYDAWDLAQRALLFFHCLLDLMP